METFKRKLNAMLQSSGIINREAFLSQNNLKHFTKFIIEQILIKNDKFFDHIDINTNFIAKTPKISGNVKKST